MPYEKTVLYANITGFVKEIRVDYGDRVKDGQPLAVLDVPELEKVLDQKQAMVGRATATIQQAEAALKAAAARLDTTKAAYERWESEYKRLEGLVRDKVLDEQNRDETLNQFKAAAAAHKESGAKHDLARADLLVAEAQLKIAEAEEGEIKALLRYTQIKAPYPGVVTERFLHTGAFINTKTGDHPVLSVMRTDVLRLVVEVPEKDVRFLKNGGEIEVDLDAFPGKKFTWTITRLAPVLGAGKKARVEAEIKNTDNGFYPGMYGHAVVVLEKKSKALTLPAVCVLADDRGAYVWCVADGTATRKDVKTGINDGKQIEIVMGLNGQEAVVISGKESLREGQEVSAKKVERK
jgi:RND family efflux transporter MFP subunit